MIKKKASTTSRFTWADLRVLFLFLLLSLPRSASLLRSWTLEWTARVNEIPLCSRRWLFPVKDFIILNLQTPPSPAKSCDAPNKLHAFGVLFKLISSGLRIAALFNSAKRASFVSTEHRERDERAANEEQWWFGASRDKIIENLKFHGRFPGPSARISSYCSPLSSICGEITNEMREQKANINSGQSISWP